MQFSQLLPDVRKSCNFPFMTRFPIHGSAKRPRSNIEEHVVRRRRVPPFSWHYHIQLQTPVAFGKNFCMLACGLDPLCIAIQEVQLLARYVAKHVGRGLTCVLLQRQQPPQPATEPRCDCRRAKSFCDSLMSQWASWRTCLPYLWPTPVSPPEV